MFIVKSLLVLVRTTRLRTQEGFLILVCLWNMGNGSNSIFNSYLCFRQCKPDTLSGLLEYCRGNLPLHNYLAKEQSYEKSTEIFQYCRADKAR